MTLVDAATTKKRLSTIFERKGGDGQFTCLFENLNPAQREILSRLVELNSGELPVIGSVRNFKTWLLLTTERLVWAVDGKRTEISAESIRDATADLNSLPDGPQEKLEMRHLQVTTHEDKNFLIEIEPGPPLSGTWNVLKNLAGRNRRKEGV